MFDERKKIFIKLLYSQDNEKLSKRFINKLNIFTDGHFMFIILWQTRIERSKVYLTSKTGTNQM